MRLILIRHGDPDYSIDSLTPKGRKEAELLVNWIAKQDIKDIYVSPLGRARDTAEYSLKALNRDAVVLPWLREFWIKSVINPITGTYSCGWDFMPSEWTESNLLYDKDKWFTEKRYAESDNTEAAWRELCDGLDGLLSEYGYHRYKNYYRVDSEKSNEDTLVFFCHFGISMVITGYLLGISPVVLLQGFFMAPSSVTILQTEERIKGEAAFRCRLLGGITHLEDGNEQPSESGAFSQSFKN